MHRSQYYQTDQVSSDVRELFLIEDALSTCAHRAVYPAKDRSSTKRFAIKRLRPFNDPTLCVRALREIKFLRLFTHENIIAIAEIVTPPKYDNFTEIYLVQELMHTDLSKVIGSRQVSDDNCCYIMWQILRALETMHSANVIHRDLKPSNLLCNENYDLKVGDLSHARITANVEDEQSFSIERVATLAYRAPDLLLSFSQYTKAIDIWSAGCILAEILGEGPIFCGKNSLHQLDVILSTLGTSRDDDLEWISSQTIRTELRSLPPRRKVPWNEIFSKASHVVLDLLEKLLRLNPLERLTVDKALDHAYFEPYHQFRNSTPTLIPNSLFDFDRRDCCLSGEQLKSDDMR